MPVTSRPLHPHNDESNDEPQPRRQVLEAQATRFAFQAMAYLIAIPLWIAGARYTLDGWIVAINWFLAWLGSTLPGVAIWQIPPIRSFLMYLGLAGFLGFVYSIVEIKQAKAIKSRGWRALSFGAAVVWLFANISDIGSTFFGIVAPPMANAWPITVWLANTIPAALGWAIIVTYVPELLFMYAARFHER